LDPKRLNGYCKEYTERRYKILNCAKDSKKRDNGLSDQRCRPDLLGRNIVNMGPEKMAPDIKKGAQTKEDKSPKPDPTRHVVEGDPAHVMIPAYDVTFCLSLTALLHLHGADI